MNLTDCDTCSKDIGYEEIQNLCDIRDDDWRYEQCWINIVGASLSLSSPYVEDDDWEYEQCWINIVGASLSLPLPPSHNIDQ